MSKIILAIIIIVVIAGAGYLVYQRLNNTELEENKITPENNTENTVEDIMKGLLADKYSKDISEVTIAISKEEGNYISGSVTFGEGGPGEGGNFLAVKEGSVWKITYDGNGTIPCSSVDPYNFPSDIVPSCFDESSGEMIDRI